MNTTNQNPIITLCSIEGSYLLNTTVLTKDELCLYFQYLGFEVPKCLSELKFRVTVMRTLECLEYEDIVDSLSFFEYLLKTHLTTEAKKTLFRQTLEKRQKFLDDYSRN
jgi:hypothetical protein